MVGADDNTAELPVGYVAPAIGLDSARLAPPLVSRGREYHAARAAVAPSTWSPDTAPRLALTWAGTTYIFNDPSELDAFCRFWRIRRGAATIAYAE